MHILRRHAQDGRSQGFIQPPAGDDLSAVLAGLTRVWRDDFDGTTLNATRWNILAEPGQSQSSALGPVLEFPDHWGTYTHDPALVTLEGGILRLGWGVTAGAWRAGGITSASVYGTATSAKASSIYGVTRVRARVPVTAGNSFGATWQMPVENAYGAWPNSGEIDGFEWTQQTNLSAADRRIGYGNVILAGGDNSRNTSALANPAVDILDGQFHEWAWRRRLSGSDVVVTFYVDSRQFGEVTISGTAADPLRRAFYYLLTAQLGFWRAGLPPDETLASQHFELDWIEQWETPAAPPITPGDPSAAAPVLQAKGLSLVWQDRIGRSGGPANDREIFQTTTGSRISEDPPTGYPSENNRRLSLVTFDGKPCLESIYRAGQHGWLNYRSQWLPTGYRKFGLAVDVFIPSDFDLINSSGVGIDGKSMFGFTCGHADHHRPGVPSGYSAGVPSGSWRGEVCYPEDQKGCALGLNTRFRETTRNMEFGWYPHVPGRMISGSYAPRLNAFSLLGSISGMSTPGKVAVPKGRWWTLTLYGEIDSNAANGVLEWYIDSTLQQSVTGIDLGGWVGNRNLYRGRSATAAPDGMAESDVNRQHYSFGWGDLSNTDRGQNALRGGWRFRGIFLRDMLGGTTSDPSRVPRSTCRYYAHNWRVYGLV